MQGNSMNVFVSAKEQPFTIKELIARYVPPLFYLFGATSHVDLLVEDCGQPLTASDKLPPADIFTVDLLQEFLDFSLQSFGVPEFTVNVSRIEIGEPFLELFDCCYDFIDCFPSLSQS